MSEDVIAALRAENERLKSREEAFLAYEKGRDEEVAALRAENERLRKALNFLMETKWKSVDKDNMEFEGPESLATG